MAATIAQKDLEKRLLPQVPGPEFPFAQTPTGGQNAPSAQRTATASSPATATARTLNTLVAPQPTPAQQQAPALQLASLTQGRPERPDQLMTDQTGQWQTVPVTTLPATTLPATVPAQPPAETVPAMTLPAQLSQFGPGQDLISTQISPIGFTPSEAAERARALTLQGLESLFSTPDRAALASQQFRCGPRHDPTSPQIPPTGFPPSEAAERARALTLQGLESLFSTPDRAALASQQFRDLLEQAAEARQTGVRDIGRAAAALGRIGAGITTSQLGDLEERIQTQIAREASRLAAETAGQELADRLARFQAALGAGGQLRGEDLAEARFGQSLRDELRGERAYQYGLSRDEIADRIRQIQLEEQLLQGEHSREMDRINALLSIALGGPDPLYALERAAAGAQGQAGQFWDLVGEILRLYGQRREQQQRSSTT